MARARQGLLALALLVSTYPVSAHEYYTESFQVIHPWTYPVPAGTGSVGVYMRFVEINTGDRLLSATSDIAEKIELRTRPRVGATSDIPAPSGIELPAGRDVSLSPFTDHLVLSGLKVELHEGRQYPLLLMFEKSGEVLVDVVIGAH